MNICCQRQIYHQHYGLTTTAAWMGVSSPSNHKVYVTDCLKVFYRTPEPGSQTCSSCKKRLLLTGRNLDKAWAHMGIVTAGPNTFHEITNPFDCRTVGGLKIWVVTLDLKWSDYRWRLRHHLPLRSNTIALVTRFCSLYFQVHSSSNTSCCVLFFCNIFNTLCVYKDKNVTKVGIFAWPRGKGRHETNLSETNTPASSFPQGLVDVGTNWCFYNDRHSCTVDFRTNALKLSLVWRWYSNSLKHTCPAVTTAPSMREFRAWCRISIKRHHVWLVPSHRPVIFPPWPPFFWFSSTLPFLSLTTSTSPTATFNFHYAHVQRLMQPTRSRQGNNMEIMNSAVDVLKFSC